MEQRFKNFHDVIEFAIKREKDAQKFYKLWADKSTDEGKKKFFLEMYEEEKKHEENLKKILNMSAEEISKKADEKVMDLKMADFYVVQGDRAEVDYQEALIIAMKKEKASFKLYMRLSEIVDNEELKTLFLALANEEAKHKLKMEIAYDDLLYPEA